MNIKIIDKILIGVISAVVACVLFPAIAQASELDDAAAKVEEAQQAYDAATAKQEELAAQIEELDAGIAEIEEKLPQQEADAASVMRGMYRENTSTVSMLIESLLNTDSFSQLIQWYDYYNKIVEYRAGVLNDAKESKAQLQADKAAQEQAKQEQDEAVAAAEQAKKDAQVAYNKAKAAAQNTIRVSNGGGNGEWRSGFMTLSQMKFQGVVYANGYRYTYYSESVLPGNGLSIPGRHHANGCVVDGDGYICVASSDLARGTVVPTPLGDGKVYDCGCASGTIDLYIA